MTGRYPEVKARRCPAHPFRKRPMAEPNEELALCAYMSAVLAHHKVRDDLQDEGGLKRTAATVAAPFAAGFRRRALKRGYAQADAAVADVMQRLCKLESERPPSVDEPASLFGELMALLLSHGLTGNQEKLACAIGRHVGRWVYILDAADDFAEDLKRGRYNPLACLYAPLLAEEPHMKELPLEKRREIKIALLNELAELECAFDLLEGMDNPDTEGILRNILYMGLPGEAERVLFGSRDCERESAHIEKE